MTTTTITMATAQWATKLLMMATIRTMATGDDDDDGDAATGYDEDNDGDG